MNPSRAHTGYKDCPGVFEELGGSTAVHNTPDYSNCDGYRPHIQSSIDYISRQLEFFDTYLAISVLNSAMCQAQQTISCRDIDRLITLTSFFMIVSRK